MKNAKTGPTFPPRAILVAALAIGLALPATLFCSDGITPRQRCYARNSCDSALEDCVIGALATRELLLNCEGQQDRTLCDLSLAVCLGADSACRADCDSGIPL